MPNLIVVVFMILSIVALTSILDFFSRRRKNKELDLIKALALPDLAKGLFIDSHIGYYGTVLLKYQVTLPRGLVAIMVPITHFMPKEDYPKKLPPKEADFSKNDIIRYLYEIKSGEKNMKILFYHKNDFLI